MKTRRIIFEEVSIKRTFRWIDPVTGRKRQETRKFWQTLNPANLDASGHPKSRYQVQAEIQRDADLWLLHKENDAREAGLRSWK